MKDIDEFFRTFDRKIINSKDEETVEELIESFLNHYNSKIYNRILSSTEKIAISSEAYGYLLKLYELRSIDRNTFEKIISTALMVQYLLKINISKKIIEKITILLIFSGKEELQMKDIIDYVLITKDDEMTEPIN